MSPKRVLILTSDAGLGHRRAAVAIDKALKQLFGEQCKTKLVNPLTLTDAPDYIQRLEEGYSERVAENPTLYSVSYYALDMPIVSGITTRVMSGMLDDVMVQLIEDFNPHVIVTTYPTYSRPSAKALKKLDRSVPVLVTITDLADVQSIWYSNKATLHFVPSDDIRRQAVDNGIPASRIQVTGLPVDPTFADEDRETPALREALGWDVEPTTCLLVAGPRTSQMDVIAQKLDRAQIGLQLVVVSGGDSGLYARLKDADWQGNLRLYDWVDDMPTFMHAADFIISKAGGLIVSESLACGLPLVLSEALPGQEVGNVKYVVNNGAGDWAPSPLEVLSTVHQWLRNDGSLLNERRHNARKLGRPEAALTIARGLWGLATTSASQNQA